MSKREVRRKYCFSGRAERSTEPARREVMKKTLSLKHGCETDVHRFIATGLFFLLLLSFVSCGGDNSGNDTGNSGPPSVTDNSGDFPVTVTADSSSQLYVSWPDVTCGLFALTTDKASRIYRDNANIVPWTSPDPTYYTDSGLLGNTSYCYRVEISMNCQAIIWPSVTSVLISSGTACIATL